MWWRSSVAWYRWVAHASASNVGCPAARVLERIVGVCTVRPVSTSQSRSGQPDLSIHRSRRRAPTAPERSDEAHHAGHRGSEPVAGRAASPWSPAEEQVLSVPSSCGTCGGTPLCAMRRPRLVGDCSNARFTQRSRIVLFHVGAAAAREDRPVRVRRGRTTRRSTGGARARRPWRGLRHGLLAHRAGVAPAAASPATRACPARRPRRTARAGRCGHGRAPGRGRPRVRARRRGGTRRPVPRRARAVDGARLTPLVNSRSPFTENVQSCIATSRKPVRRPCDRSGRRRRAPRR
jgi:hypothetical protein